MRIRTYSELMRLDTFEERYDYLQLGGEVGAQTFGYNRWVNQAFYHSRDWKQVRSHVIARDYGLDLGSEDFHIHGSVSIHHMNPLTLDDLVDATENMLEPEFLISTSHATHNAVHYGDRGSLPRLPVERVPGDTLVWNRKW